MQWKRTETKVVSLGLFSVESAEKYAIHEMAKISLNVPGFMFPQHIGSWMYSRRRRVKNSDGEAGNNDMEFVVDSLMPRRKNIIIGIICHLQTHIALAKSENSIKGIYAQLFLFVVWCDQNFKKGLDDRESFIEGLSRYTNYLNHCVRVGRLNKNTAAQYQQIVILAGKAIYQDAYDDLFRCVPRIKRSLASTVKTEVPCDEGAARVFRAYVEIFGQLSEIAIDQCAFPKSLYVLQNKFWFFPNSLPIAGPSTIAQKPALEKRFHCYNYTNGKLRSVNKVAERLGTGDRKIAASQLSIAKKLIAEANDDPFHRARVFAATFASQAFVMIFAANTGMNLSQIVSLRWNDDFEVVKDRLGFKGIKRRAGGKAISFYLSTSIFPLFKRYLILRKYLLEVAPGKAVSDLLFFAISREGVQQLGTNAANYFNTRMKNCFGIESGITTRNWRAYKADWLISNSDLYTTSLILQNSPETVMRHYAEGSESKAEKEMTVFFDSYKKNVRFSSRKSDIEINVGHCHSRKPSVLKGVGVSPDCKQEEGCLFCEKYRVHLDMADYKKLLSFKYILEISRTLARDADHYNSIMPLVIGRIDSILEAMESESDVVGSESSVIKKEVYQLEKLDPYWAAKLRLIDDLGFGV